MKYISVYADKLKRGRMDLIYPLSNDSPTPKVYSASVAGLGAEDPTTVTFTKDAGFPTSFPEWTDADNNVFVKIPTMYRTIDDIADGQITAFTISTAPISEDSQPYSVFVKPNGDVMPYVCIGKYMSTSNTKLNSVAHDDVLLATGDISTMRTAAAANGNGYLQSDWQFNRLLGDLILVISQKVNFQDGTAGISLYLGIDDFASAQGWWLDGVTIENGVYAICYDPTYYVDSATPNTSHYHALSYSGGTAGDIKKLGYDLNNPFCNLCAESVTNTSYNTYYCDQYTVTTTNRPIYTRIGYNAAAAGIWMQLIAAFNSVKTSRLCYRPLSLTI